jgi:CRP-like cAMP-binding protein
MPPTVPTWPPGTFLGRIKQETRDVVLSLGRRVRFDDGQDVVVEGASSRHVFILLKGWYKVVSAQAADRETLVAIRVGGDLVGELGGLDGEQRIASVRAVGPGSARMIEAKDFHRLMNRFPDSMVATSRVVADRLRVATRRQVEFASCPTPTRVARVLAELGTAHGRSVPGGVMLDIDLTQIELAALAGTTEPTVHRALTSLRGAGVIDTGYRRIVILDFPGLLHRGEA